MVTDIMQTFCSTIIRLWSISNIITNLSDNNSTALTLKAVLQFAKNVSECFILHHLNWQEEIFAIKVSSKHIMLRWDLYIKYHNGKFVITSLQPSPLFLMQDVIIIQQTPSYNVVQYHMILHKTKQQQKWVTDDTYNSQKTPTYYDASVVCTQKKKFWSLLSGKKLIWTENKSL